LSRPVGKIATAMATAKMDLLVSEHFNALPQPRAQVLAEYIWPGTHRIDTRSKTCTLDIARVESLKDIPEWEFDGSLTRQSYGTNADVVLRPVGFWPDPFRRGNHVLVLCECILTERRTPIPTNTRDIAHQVFSQIEESEAVFSVIQEYGLMTPEGSHPTGSRLPGTPLGWPRQGGFPGGAGDNNSYAVGIMRRAGHRLSEAHFRACLYSGLQITNQHSGKFKGEWSFELGAGDGMTIADQLVIARWILLRVGEEFGTSVNFDPKPYKHLPHRRRCTVQFSTGRMRDTSKGFSRIVRAVEKLGRRHREHFAVYGNSNMSRKIASYETAPMNKFSYGIANVKASVNIPRKAKLLNAGYFEDRRPSANMDPYVVTAKIARTIILE